jgi:hypothetical protein
MNNATSPLTLKKRSGNDLYSNSQLGLQAQSKSENGAFKKDEGLKNHDTDDSYLDSDESPTYKKDTSLDGYAIKQTTNYTKRTKLNLSKPIIDAQTPNFQ